jgi:hypothetical protein
VVRSEWDKQARGQLGNVDGKVKAARPPWAAFSWGVWFLSELNNLSFMTLASPAR